MEQRRGGGIIHRWRGRRRQGIDESLPTLARHLGLQEPDPSNHIGIQTQLVHRDIPIERVDHRLCTRCAHQRRRHRVNPPLQLRPIQEHVPIKLLPRGFRIGIRSQVLGQSGDTEGPVGRTDGLAHPFLQRDIQRRNAKQPIGASLFLWVCRVDTVLVDGVFDEGDGCGGTDGTWADISGGLVNEFRGDVVGKDKVFPDFSGETSVDSIVC